jgi:hypothetical protein
MWLINAGCPCNKLIADCVVCVLNVYICYCLYYNNLSDDIFYYFYYNLYCNVNLTWLNDVDINMPQSWNID